jgi:hypothetical protein
MKDTDRPPCVLLVDSHGIVKLAELWPAGRFWLALSGAVRRYPALAVPLEL